MILCGEADCLVGVGLGGRFGAPIEGVGGLLGVSSFLRKVKTASGVTAVQIVEKRSGRRRIVEHVGSAHNETELAGLLSAARQRLHGLQDEALPIDPVPSSAALSGPVLDQKASKLLWDVLTGADRHLGFDHIGDEVFAQLVGARIIEPTSTLDTIRVLGDLGLAAPHRNTIGNCLRRCVERDYRGQVATACWAHVQAAGPVALVMYDLTTLHFEITDEDRLRKVGMSKEHRIDPQVTVGLLVTANGFPLEIAMFDGSKAETKTLVPVKAFRARHNITELVVVADAGILSAGNLNALEDAGCRFIVGSRQSRAPYDLADHVEAHGNCSPECATIETGRDMGIGKDKRTRRVVYHYSAARLRREERAINAQIAKAEKVAAGKRPTARDRFVTITGNGEGKKAEVNWAVIERARASTGDKGYLTNIGADVMDADPVLAAYHDLWHVEASFRMAKSDLAARPISCRRRHEIGYADLSVMPMLRSLCWSGPVSG